GGNGGAASTVSGGIGGAVMADWVAGRAMPRLVASLLDAAEERFTAPLGRRDGENLYALQHQLREVMWEHVGLIRHASGLKSALRDIEDIGQRAPAAPVPGGAAFNLAWNAWMHLRNQATAA